MKNNNSIKRFELNKAALKDFDKLMSMNLAEVEELIVTELDKDFKILNIISLCLNVKSLVIDGNQRMDTNAILMNICKPNLLESIVMRNVKLPTEKYLKKFINLRIISLSEIRFCNVENFFKSIVHPKLIEGISLMGIDFAGADISILSRFQNVKIMNLKRLKNCRFENLSFIKELPCLDKIILKESTIKPEELNGIIKGKFKKDVYLEIENDADSNVKDYIEINDEEGISIKVNTVSLDTIVNKVSFYKFDRLILVLDNENNIEDYLKKLKKIKNKIELEVKDFSCLTVEDAVLLSERLKIDCITIIDEDGDLDYKNQKGKIKYSIEEYIEIRKLLNIFVQNALKYETELEQFLCVYKEVGLYLEKDYDMKFSESDITNTLNMLNEKKTFKEGYAEVLQNVLAILGIESNYIKGIVNKEEHLWNQVCIDGIWYNVDLEKDKEAISKKGIFRGRVEYCLVSDEMFLKTHLPKSKKRNFAPRTIDVKLVRTFIKKSRPLKINKDGENNITIDEDINIEKNNSLAIIIEKIKNICKNNRVKTLPEGKVENININEDKK